MEEEDDVDAIKSFANSGGVDSAEDEGYEISASDIKDFKAMIREKGKINFSDADDGPEDYQPSNENLDMFGEEEVNVKSYKSGRDLEKYIKEQLEQISLSLGAAENDYSHTYTPESGIDPYNVPEDLTRIIIGKSIIIYVI
jgi:hypothetical protein